MDVDADHSEGERLTGFLTAAPVLARGALRDGRSWIVRVRAASDPAARLPRVVVAVDEGVGHSLASLAPPGPDADLAAQWMSRPRGARGPGALVLAAPAVHDVRRDAEDGGAEGGAVEGELMHRDPAGWAVFLLEPRRRGGTVVGTGDAGDVVARVAMERDVDPEWSVWATRPELPPRLGAVLVAVTMLLGVAALVVALEEGPTRPARILVGVLGLLAALTAPARAAWAAHRGDPPAPSPRPAHTLIGVGTALGVALSCWFWLLQPTASSIPLLVGEAAAIAGVMVLVDYRQDRR